MRGIIFDFNGVLLWDGPLHEQAWAEFSRELRGDPLTPAEMTGQVHGRTNLDILTYLLGRAPGPDELDRLTQRKEGLYRRLCLASGDAFALSPGATGLLDSLKARAIPRTIATASERSNLDFFIRHLQLGRWFDLEQIAYDDGSLRGKPAPDLYLLAAERLGLAPADCLVVEDAESGIAAARAASIGRIIALGPADRHRHLLQLAGVSDVVRDLGELVLDDLISP